MRKEIYRLEREAALGLLARARVIHLATTNDEGLPLLRALHAVVVGGGLCFHGAPAGEKQEAIGRRAVAQAEEILAEIPSYFLDPERACPATTYYESAQLHGVIEEVTDPGAKAAALQALMEKYQPEGGHARIDAADERYRKAVAGVQVLRLPLSGAGAVLDGKAKLGQNRGPADLGRVLEALWARGLSGDPRAIDKVAARLQAAHGVQALPPLLRGPAGTTLACAVGDRPGDEAAVVALLRGAYWNDWVTEERLLAAHRGSVAWVGARDAGGALVATARALSDGGKFAAVYDVMVAPAYRGRGVGAAVMRLLLAHPALRGAARVWLRTKDADGFYRRLGFLSAAELPPRAFVSRELWLVRGD